MVHFFSFSTLNRFEWYVNVAPYPKPHLLLTCRNNIFIQNKYRFDIKISF